MLILIIGLAVAIGCTIMLWRECRKDEWLMPLFVYAGGCGIMASIAIALLLWIRITQ